jgi:Carboxypeptidase regulatory-like domain
MNRNDLVGMVLVAAFFLSIGSSLLAQTGTTGAIVGTVADPSGASVPGAIITLEDIAKGTRQTSTSGPAGEYRFDLVPPSDYIISVKATGFEIFNQRIVVAIGQVSAVDIKLVLGAQTQTITVSEEATPLIQADTANVASTINEKQAQNLPNPGNDITYIAQIAPGSTMSTGAGYGNFSSYGLSGASNLFTLNGMDDNDPFFNLNNSGATNLMLGANEIQEVAVVSNGYSGEFGGLAGSNINFVTRSGTNSFHGRATWYWNGRAMNANNFFSNITDTPRSFVNANQYGADFGGPIVKNKMFFYFNAEGLYLLIPTSQPVFLPSPAFEGAVSKNIATQFSANPMIQAFYANMFNIYNAAPGASRATNTLPDAGCDGSESFINPAGYTFGVKSASNPLGNGTPCALTFRSNIGNATHENLQAGRFDWNITNNDRFFVRVEHDLGLQASWTDPVSAAFNADSNQPQWQGQANETHAFANGAVNQLIFSGSWYSSIFNWSNQTAALASFPQNLAFGSGALTDLGGLNDLWPSGRNVTQLQFSDDYSKPLGAHTLKVGFKFRKNWISDWDYGSLSYGFLSPSNLDAFFWGGTDPNAKANSSFAIQAFPTFLKAPFTVFNLGGYVEDDWKVKPELTVTLAFRLEHLSQFSCTINCFVRAASTYPELSVDPTTPYDQLLLTDRSHLLPSLTSVEPEPRIGFAWQPRGFRGLGNTVVRGGFGIFYDLYPGYPTVDAISENGTNEPTFTVATGTLSSPSDPGSLLATAAGANAAFQAGFKSGGSLSSISATDPAFTPPNLSLSTNNPQVMRVYKWSLGVERQFGVNTSFSLQYVGNHGSHGFFQNGGINACNNIGTFVSLPACNLTTGAGVNPNFVAVTEYMSNANSNYNGMTMSLTHRYKSGLWQINYTWSHALDDVSNSGALPFIYNTTGGPQAIQSLLSAEDPANPKLYNYGSSDYDARQQLNANYVWELPIKRLITRGHGPDRLVNGWTVNGTVFFRTGFPTTPVDLGTAGDLGAAGYTGYIGGLNVWLFATQVKPGGLHVSCTATFPGTPQPSRDDCVNPANFSISPDGFPSTTRNYFTGPSFFNTDFSLIKHTRITERVEFVFGAQFYNVFNHPNFAPPVMNVASPEFGQQVLTVNSPTSLYGAFLGADSSPRLIQFKTQLNF